MDAWSGRSEGLNPPATVTEATKEYFSAEDSFGQWLEECCETDAADWEFERTSDLYSSFKDWCVKAGENAPTQKRFSMTMKERELAPHRDPKTRHNGFRGLRLIRPDYTDDSRYGG